MAKTERNIAQTARVLRDVEAERDRQHEKWGEQNHPSFTGDRTHRCYFGLYSATEAKTFCEEAAKAGTLTYSHIAFEEFCESIESKEDSPELREELVQVAAVFVAWIETLDRRAGTGPEVEVQCFEAMARDLRVGDLFRYKSRLRPARVETDPVPDPKSPRDVRFQASEEMHGRRHGMTCVFAAGMYVDIERGHPE